MKKAGLIIVASVSACLLIGGIILVWSAHKSSDLERHETNVRQFTDDNFAVDVIDASKNLPILVDFYADWCMPCRMLEPVLEEIARDLNGKVVVGKVNTDKNVISRKFGIKKIPAVFIIRDGEIKNAFYGLVPKEEIMKALREQGA
jgi:thioredoxin 1